MPQILSKKNGGIYKPKEDEFHICATFKCASTHKYCKVCVENPEDSTLPADDNQETPDCGDDDLPKDTRIGPPSTSTHPGEYYTASETSEINKNSEGTDNSTYKPSALVAAKLLCNDGGLSKASGSTDVNGSSSGSSSGPLHPSFIKHGKNGSLIPTTTGYNWRKRRFAIDLGRRARVLGKFLCSIEEEDEHGFDIFDSFKTFHIIP